MTKTLLLNKVAHFSAILAVLCTLSYVVGLTGCSDSEEQTKLLEQQKRTEAREARDAQAAADMKARQDEASAAAAPQPTDTPEIHEAPAKTTVWHFTSNTERNEVKCSGDGTVRECGVTFECVDGASYYCQTGVKEWTTEE